MVLTPPKIIDKDITIYTWKCGRITLCREGGLNTKEVEILKSSLFADDFQNDLFKKKKRVGNGVLQ